MLLGCLINLDEENLVFLAHCIVQKYLESLRISEDATSYVRTGQEAMIKGCMRTVLQEAQAIDQPKEKVELISGDGIGDTPDAFLQDFVVDCVILGVIVVADQAQGDYFRRTSAISSG